MRHPHIQVPNPEPDESLHSLLIASFRLSGHASFRDFTQLIFGRPSDGRGWSWRYRSIGPYLDPCRKTGWALLQGTLLLPYLMPFMSPEAAHAGGHLLDGDFRIHRETLRSNWHVFNVRPLRYCPVCVKSNVHRLGRSLWLRSHQLGDVNVCWRHAVRLIKVQQEFTFPLLPHEFEDQRVEYSFNKPDLWLAQQARELLMASYSPSLPQHRSEIYQARAIRLGYITSGKIDSWAIASHLGQRLDRAFLSRVCGGATRNCLTSFVHRVISGQGVGIRPNHHLLCIEALFGAQRPFFQQLRLLGMGQEPSRDLQSRLSSGNDGSGLVHREIFLHELQANGRDVMLHLEERYPFTHSWILKHALPWSRRKIAELVPPSPDRKSILRAAARDRQSEEAAVRERQRRAMSAIGGQPTQTDVPANSSKSAELVFHGMSKLLPRASWVSPATRRSNG